MELASTASEEGPGVGGRSLDDKAERLPFLDRLRGLAAVVMLEVHVLNALLFSGRRAGRFFATINFLNGLVAPAFLFCAGFALAISLRRSWGGHRWNGLLLASLRRGAYLLAVGYGLHGSSFLWHGFFYPRAWAEFWQADILQVIAISLTFLSLLAFALRRPGRFAFASLLAGALVLLLTPYARALSTSGWPAWARPYFSDGVITEFPLLPWAAFAILGAAVGVRPSAHWGKKLVAAAGAAGVAAGVMFVLSPRILPPHSPWSAGPPYMLARFAVVCLLGALLSIGAGASAGGERGPVRRFVDRVLLRFSRHSLLIYVVHIPLVYGGYGFSMRASIGTRQGYLGCGMWFVALAAAMYLLAATVDAIKAYRAKR